jgi:hypothetical protein
VQPYFPRQIVFSPDNGTTIFAIDEINQRAYKILNYNSTRQDTSYVEQHFPYAVSDSPQSKYYVQLLIESPNLGCQYGTYWKYGGNNFNTFPARWWSTLNSFEIKTYLEFNHEMIHSNDSSVDEDHWYSNITCQPDSGEIVPCQQIYLKKNTQIPLRFVEVVRRGWNLIQITTNYKVISVGKPDEKYFDSIPKNWSVACRDTNLGLLYYPQMTKINLTQNAEFHIYLAAPPHRVNGNDTVTIQWKASECSDCFTWTPKQLSFNIENFQERQTLTITRIKNAPTTNLIPIFNGGGFDFVTPEAYPIIIE